MKVPCKLLSPPSGDQLASHSGVEKVLDGPRAERFYTWSRRWMEAEKDRSSKRSDQIAAVQAHLDRMRRLEEGGIIRDLAKRANTTFGNVSLPPGEFRTSLEFYRLEAESWLAKAKSE